MRLLCSLLFLIVAFGFTANSHAAIMTWSAVLTSGQEVAPNVSTSTATGFGMVTFDDVTNALVLDLSWTGLTGPGLQAHIHCCAPPTANAGIAVDLWLLSDPPQPPTGSFSRSFDLDTEDPFRATFLPGETVATKFAALRAAMDTQNAYYNIHTGQFPGGEIRGNLSPTAIPEPATLLLTALGVGVLGYRRARRMR
jgi:hypothetical protein